MVRAISPTFSSRIFVLGNKWLIIVNCSNEYNGNNNFLIIFICVDSRNKIREKKLMYKNFEIEVLFIELQELLRFRSKLDETRWRENDTCATVWREDVTKIMLSHSSSSRFI